MKPITILLIDDHPVVRAGYLSLIQKIPDMHVVAEAENGEAGYQLYQEHLPDVTMLDLNLPGIDGLETIRRITSFDPAARILIVSMLNNATVAQRSLQAGAAGFFSKQGRTSEMIQAIREINSGKKFIASELASELAINATCKDPHGCSLDTLTKREFQIFKLIAEGNSSTKIAENLSISIKTVNVHHYNLMQKLQIKNSMQLVHIAISHNIL